MTAVLSIGAATDYLVTTAQAAVTGITVEGQNVEVVDGVADEVSLGVFAIGAVEPPPNGTAETVETRTYIGQGVGSQQYEEDYTIPCYIDIRLPGTNQKAARDIAETVFKAFWPLIHADLTLGGVLGAGRLAEISDLTEVPSNVGTVAEPGRRQLIRFGVHCKNLTT